MQSLASIDWLIVMLYLFFAISTAICPEALHDKQQGLFPGRAGAAGVALRAGVMAASLGSQEVIGMGAAGAKYSLAARTFTASAPFRRCSFVGLFMMPIYYGSKARSVPEFLRLRFDEKTRGSERLPVCGDDSVFSGDLDGRDGAADPALHVFDAVVQARWAGSPAEFDRLDGAPAAIVLLYILLGGLTGAIYNQVLQFFLLAAGLLPMVLLGAAQDRRAGAA